MHPNNMRIRVAGNDHQNALFAEWLDNHRGIIVKVARSFAAGAEVEDLAQEILLRLWKSAARFRGESSASTWIYRVALNRALTWQRDEGAAVSRLRPTAELAEIATTDTVDSALGLGRVYEVLRGFPEIDRSLLLLSLDGVSYVEMSEITGLSTSNVGARLSRARARLSQELEADHE